MKLPRRHLREAIEKIGAFSLAKRVDEIPVFCDDHQGWMAKSSDQSFGWLLTDPRDRSPIFRWRLSAGAEIPSHWHPCQENLVMLSGRLRLSTGDEISAGDHHLFAPSEAHGVTCIDDSEYLVIFQPGMRIAVSRSVQTFEGGC